MSFELILQVWGGNKRVMNEGHWVIDEELPRPIRLDKINQEPGKQLRAEVVLADLHDIAVVIQRRVPIPPPLGDRRVPQWPRIKSGFGGLQTGSVFATLQLPFAG